MKRRLHSPVAGQVVRVFRSDGSLSLGQDVTFAVNVCQRGDRIVPGPSFLFYDNFIRASHMEVFLEGSPPKCKVAMDECIVLEAPTTRPQIPASRLKYLFFLLIWKLRVPW